MHTEYLPQKETGKLWNFADQEGLFPFKTIGDVLEENQRLKEENQEQKVEIQWLNDVITTNISEIYLQLETMFNQHSEDIKSVRTEHSEDISSVKTDLGEVRTELLEDIASVRTDLEKNITSVGTDMVSLKLIGNMNS